MSELGSAAKGSISKAEFERMRNEVSELRGRALQRLNEMEQDLGSGRQFDLLTKLAEADRKEHRPLRVLRNLYPQYHGSGRRQETFNRLQANYRNRFDSAVNHVSFILNEPQ